MIESIKLKKVRPENFSITEEQIDAYILYYSKAYPDKKPPSRNRVNKIIQCQIYFRLNKVNKPTVFLTVDEVTEIAVTIKGMVDEKLKKRAAEEGKEVYLVDTNAGMREVIDILIKNYEIAP